MKHTRRLAPIVMISSYPPRLCGIGTFCEEAREFIQKEFPDREVLVISHTDGRGEGILPLIDMDKQNWWAPVVRKIKELKPYAIHIEHEYGLYEYRNKRGVGDRNEGFLKMLEALHLWPVIVEPHTVHGRLKEFEANFIYRMCQYADVVLFKCHYQKWRLEWTFPGYGWKIPRNVMVVAHGARPDRRWPIEDTSKLRAAIGLNKLPRISRHLVGLVGWIQANKRWDILTSMWEGIAKEIKHRTGEEWNLLAAGTIRDPAHESHYKKYRKEVEVLEDKGLAHYFEFIPRGDIYYKMMAVCDFIVLPTLDETQSGTLARIIAVNKPYITTAPMEGLTAQTLESEGGLLFTTKEMLREKVIRLACSEKLRMELGENLKRYLDKVASWEIIVKQYSRAYRLAGKAKNEGGKVELPLEFGKEN